MLHARLGLTVAGAILTTFLSACGASGDGKAVESAATVFSKPPTPIPRSSPPPPEMLEVAGSVSYLSTVGFAGGSARGLSFRAPREGAPCLSEAGFVDITPGSAVTVTSGTGETLATVALGESAVAVLTRHSEQERDARAELVDAIYCLRIAETWNALEQAELLEAQSKQKLYDIQNPDDWGFEGARFVAVWCRLPFAAPGLPAQDTYVVKIVNRTPTVVSRQDLESDQDALDLYLY